MKEVDPCDISELINDVGWKRDVSGDDWIIAGCQCYALRVTEVGRRLFDALRVDVPDDVARSFILSGVVVDDQLVPGPSKWPPGRQPFGAWIEVPRRLATRPVVLEIYNHGSRSCRFRTTMSLRLTRDSGVAVISLGDS